MVGFPEIVGLIAERGLPLPLVSVNGEPEFAGGLLLALAGVALTILGQKGLSASDLGFGVAAMLGARFSIMTPRRQRIPNRKEHVHMRGMDHFLASVRSLDLSVAETDADPERTKKKVLEVARLAAEEDGAEIIILGCAGMAGYAPELESKLGVKVLDPSAVALKVAEAMADLGLRHSKLGLFAPPPEKKFK